MPRVRAGYSGKYKLSKHEFYVAYHYALQYQAWLDEYNALEDTSVGLRYDRDKIQTFNGSDITATAGARRAELKTRMELVEDTARQVDEDLYYYIIKGVTSEGVTFNYLKTVMLMPCGKNMYYDRRRRFYYLLSKKLI